uniref:CTCK domain-containing protein n=1 Tax=Lates calcarifer TaxID=8187 RepID=A0A4W6FNX1_LATCA
PWPGASVELNLRDVRASTAARSTRTARASVRAANTSVPASTVPLAALLSATTSCRQLHRPAPTRGWSGYLGSAASVWTAIRAPGASHLSIRCLHHNNTCPDLSTIQFRTGPENELVLANELADVKSSGWESKHGYKHVPVWNHLKEKKCQVQTTDWSHCSRSCGMGVSSRVTNKNPQCKLEREMRICTIRPCQSLTVPAKRGKRCSPTQKAPKPVRLSFGECVSVRLYRPNYCGVCTDGQCCSPRRTRTVPVTFTCPDGERFQRSAMFIQSCKCSNDCGHLNEVALPPQHWMYGDTHKFID